MLPQEDSRYAKSLGLIRRYFGFADEAPKEMEDRGKDGVEIDWRQAVELVKPIKTKSKNTWRDSTIAAVIQKVAEQTGGNVMLKFRTAERTVQQAGFLSSGVLFGPTLNETRNFPIPTLWMFAAVTLRDSELGPGLKFMYPSFVIPSNFPKLYLFNSGT